MAVGECPGVEGKDGLEPIDPNTAVRERRDILPDVLRDNDRRIDRETASDEVIKQGRQYDLRHVDQEGDILGVPRAPARHECQTAHEGIANRASVERLDERFDGARGIVRQEVRFNGHDER